MNRVFGASALAGIITTMAISANGPEAKVERLSKEVDQLVAPDIHMEKMATGYTWTEGPVWIHAGFLMYAEIPSNSIYKLKPGSAPELFLRPSGWTDAKPFGGKEPGSNGMTLDAHGRLTVAGHARRNVYRLETLDPKGKVTVLADRFEGKRFNSPNDLVYSKDGSLYFTDPPYGLATQSDDDLMKELKFNGVFRLANALNHAPGAPPANQDLRLLVSDITRPNGLAFSPDERYLYVNSSDLNRKIWMRYEVTDGKLINGKLIYDATSDPRIGGPDGMKVDKLGNLYSTGPGGIWIFSPELKHIGTIVVPERAGNLAWGDEDGKSLYIAASSSIYRVRLKVAGIRP
jgi:gluconolactonase